ncbi:MAG: hypothetical protein J6V22_01310 [Clostridia bacterium]|nr:hypothetical protein [Clostridia bacterium]
MDNKQEKKKNKLKAYALLAFNIALYFIPCWVAIRYISPLDINPILFFVGFIAAVYAAFIFHIIIHEGGHLVFGLLTGYRFSSFRIFSFMWVKEGESVKFKRHSIAGTGGQCLMSPPDIQNGEMPVVWYNLGGSLMNIIFSTIFLVCFFLLNGVSVLTGILLLFSLFGYSLAILNGVPMRMGAIDNDGYNAISLTKDAEAREAFWMQMKVVEETTKGVRLKDMPSEWFTVPTDEAMSNSMVAARGVFACNRLMDEERFEEADELMAHLLEIESGMVGLHRSILVCERIYVELIHQNRREVVEEKLTKNLQSFMKTMKDTPSILRTQYAIALLYDGDKAKAETIKAQFEKRAKTYPYPHEIDSERDLMKLAENKFNQPKEENE